MEQENKDFVAYNNPYTGGIDFNFVPKKEPVEEKESVLDFATGQYITVNKGQALPQHITETARREHDKQLQEEYNNAHSFLYQSKRGGKRVWNLGAELLGSLARYGYEHTIQAPARAELAHQSAEPMMNALGEYVYLPDEIEPAITKEERAQKEAELSGESRKFSRAMVDAVSFDDDGKYQVGDFVGDVVGSVMFGYIGAGWNVGGGVVGTYGLNQYYDTLDFLLSKGVDYDEAHRRALVDGWLEFIMEKISLDSVLKVIKGGWRAPMKRVLFPAAVEGGTEVGQTKKTQMIREQYDDTPQADKDTELLLSGLGGVLGGIGGANYNYYRVHSSVSNYLQNKGYSKADSDAAARDVALGLKNKLIDEIENTKLLSAEDIQRGQAFIEEAQRIGGKDADTYANIMNTYRQIGKLGGLTEEEINKDAEYFANAHTSLFLALKDKDPNLTYEQYSDKIKLNSLRIIQDINIEREVNKRVKETLPWFGETSELTAEQVDEVERVAQNERFNVMREAGLIKEDDTLYSMIGERSKLTKQQKTSLDEAKSLEQDGLLNNEQIRQATGWYRGDDKKWRLEISDRDATLTDIDIKENAWTLGDLLKHKPLFSAIPQMKAVSVRYNPKIKETARVATGWGGVRIEVGSKYFKESPQEKRKTIMHEVQHIIQDFEGFARGGSNTEFRSPRMKLIDKVKWNTRIQYADLIMGMGKWKSFDEVREKIKTLENTDDELLKSHIKKFKQADEYLKEYDMNTAFQKYRRLAGEIEARNVANRIDLTDEERRKISPEETRDIPREQAIIRFDDKTESSYTPEYNPYIVNKVSYKGKEVKPYGKGIKGLIATDLAVGKTEEQIKQTARESIDYAQSQLDEVNKLIDPAREKLSDEVAKEIEDIVASSEGRWWAYENERSNADEQDYLDLLISQEDYQDSIKVANKILKADFSDYSVSSIDDTLYSRVYVNGEEVEAFDDIRTAEGKPVNYSNEGNYYDTGVNREARRGRDNTAIVRMSPQQFLGLTPERMGSRDVSAIESAINEGKEIAMPFLDVEILDADKKILKVTGHEGRHRSLAMSNLGVNNGYVILNGRDLYRNKDLFKDLSSWKILGQNETDESKAIPLSENKFPVYTDSTVNINGVEKNVYNSDGAKIAQTETPLFKEWSRNSKVVDIDNFKFSDIDKNGITVKAFHGTRRGGFRVFDESKVGGSSGNASSGFFFGSRELAETYTPEYTEFTDMNTTEVEEGFGIDWRAGMYEAYLTMRNPEVFDFQGANWDGIAYDKFAIFDEDNLTWLENENNEYLLFDSFSEAEDYLEKKGFTPYKDGDSIEDRNKREPYGIKKNPELFERVPDLAQEAKENGFDGLIVQNVNDTGGYGFGGETGNVAVVYDSTQIKSTDNIGTFDPNDPDIYYSRYNASYSDAKKIIRLFKGHNPQALVHELSHNFFMDYFRLTEEYGLTEKNKAIYDMLGKDSYKKFGEREWETITEEFMKYLKTNEAPNIALKGLFDRAKDWLIETFFTTNKSETPSPEVKEFFESLVSSGVRGADITDLRMTPRTIGDILKSIKSGNEVSFKGVRRADLKRLRNALHQTMPRKAKTLAEEMRKDDMQIKADSELAKQLGYDSKRKNPIFSEKGTIERIDELDDYLVEKGLLSKNLSETAEQVSDRENEIENIIYQAEQVYTPEEQKIADTRDAIYNNQLRTQELVDDILKDNELGIKNIDELNQYLDKAIETAKESDSIMVNQEAINFLIDGYKNAERLYEKTKKDLEKAQEQLKTAKEDLSVLNKTQKDLTRAQDINGVREQLMGYIRALPISAKHRLSLMDKVKQVKKGDDFTEVLGNINDSFKKMWEQETKEILANNINEIIKSTKPKERRKQKYNYDYNTLFEEFRDINKLKKNPKDKKEKSIVDVYFAELEKIKNKDSEGYTESFADDKSGVREEMDRVKRMLISYKMNGRKDSSVTLMRELEKSLFDLRQDAIEDKARTDTEKAIKRNAEIDRAVDYIQGTKKAGGVLGFYLKNTNLYSNEAELFGSDWAREHEMETIELEKNRLVREKTKRMIEKGKRIYGIPEDTGAKRVVSASDKEFARLMNEKSQEIYSLHGVNGDAESINIKISLLQIMDIYNTIKNKNSAEIYAELYESFDEEGNQLSHNIQDLIDNLSDQDKAFADAVMADIQSLRESENDTYVRLYGIDMIRLENYYPRSAKKRERELMDIKKFAIDDNTPSFFKERAKRSLLVPRNMWTKYQSRINDSMYMTHEFEKYKEHYDLIHNLKVQNAIESKYDSKRYTSLITSLKDLSLGGNHSTFDEMENVMGNMVSNWVVSKIAMNDAVFGKQLISFTNYMENMPVTDFFKYEAEFWANPMKAIKFMQEFDGDYLNQRFSEGMQNEALAQIMTNAERSIKKRDYIFQDYIDFVTLPVRLGDVGAIYIGGYARVKYLLDHGFPLDEARKTFEFESVRSQQSGLKSSMAQFQKNTAVRFFSAFKNTQLQYQRKLFDGWIQWRRNEISTEQYAKMAANYMFLQSLLYQVASNVFSYWRDDDDDKELEYMKDVPMQIITSPIAGVPLVGDFVQNLLKENSYDLGVAGLQDLNRAMRLVRKSYSEMQEGEFNPKTAEKAGALLIQFVKPLPANILNNILTE